MDCISRRVAVSVDHIGFLSGAVAAGGGRNPTTGAAAPRVDVPSHLPIMAGGSRGRDVVRPPAGGPLQPWNDNPNRRPGRLETERVDPNTRIAQFEKMAADDPNNELGHFSLGKAYLEAGRFEESAAALKRALDINPQLSKAYDFLGDALERGGQPDLAIEFLTRGVTVADERGDMKARDAMIDKLRACGAAVPKLRAAAAGGMGAGAAGASAHAGPAIEGFQCSRCGRPTGKHEKPPFKGAVGQKIYDNVCVPCFREWVGMGTKVINELGLVMANPRDQATYDQYMMEFLQLEA